tara:strand:- start:199 stop:621 length:423 start_codon:yes stop_codon:yes gene_type:complete
MLYGFIDMSILKKIFTSQASDLVNSVGNAIDKMHTSAEEKELVKAEIQKQIQQHENKIQQEVTKRWEADMQSDNWLAKSVRPISLLFLLFVLTVFTLVDFSYVELEIKDSYIDLWQMLSITAFGAYFGGRSYEKVKNGKQ